MGIMNILEKIIENDGSCTKWANPEVCAQCPLSKLRKKQNGHFLSCIEAIGAQDLTEEEADAKYKEIAARLLLDEAVDDLLGEPNESKSE